MKQAGPSLTADFQRPVGVQAWVVPIPEVVGRHLREDRREEGAVSSDRAAAPAVVEVRAVSIRAVPVPEA